jgi:hypothetical protein
MENLLCVFPSFWWLLATLGLSPHNSSLFLQHHLVFCPLGVCLCVQISILQGCESLDQGHLHPVRPHLNLSVYISRVPISK